MNRTIDNQVDGTFTTPEPITNHITLYQYDPLSRAIATTTNHDLAQSTRTATNRITQTGYDPITGRGQGPRDALGRCTSYAYDALGRVTTTIQNCLNAGDAAAPKDCTAFSATRFAGSGTS